MSDTLEVLRSRYGNKMLLSIEDISEILGLTQVTIRNQLSEKRCPIPVYKDGHRRVARVIDVAKHIDSLPLATKSRRGPKTKAEKIAAAAQAGGAA